MTPINNYLPVIVPADAHSFELFKNNMLRWKRPNQKSKYWDVLIIPPGSYTIGFKGCDATEDDAAMVVETYLKAYKDYVHKGLVYTSALLSLHSLCTFLGGTPETVLFLNVKEQ